MSVRVNAVTVATEDLLNRLRTPAITSLATGGIKLPGQNLDVPMVLLAHQDGAGSKSGNLSGDEGFSTLFFNILAVVPAGNLEAATAIDSEIRKVLSASAIRKPVSTSRGVTHSIVLMNDRSYIGPGKDGVGSLLYHGGYWRVRVAGNEL